MSVDPNNGWWPITWAVVEKEVRTVEMVSRNFEQGSNDHEPVPLHLYI